MAEGRAYAFIGILRGDFSIDTVTGMIRESPGSLEWTRYEDTQALSQDADPILKKSLLTTLETTQSMGLPYIFCAKQRGSSNPIVAQTALEHLNELRASIDGELVSTIIYPHRGKLHIATIANPIPLC